MGIIIYFPWYLHLMTALILLQEYKPPASKDIPIDFRIALLRDAPNPIGILGTKGSQCNLKFVVLAYLLCRCG